jgi:hypothetical protein
MADPPSQSTGKTHRIIKRFIDSGIDFALEHFWLGFVLAMIATGTAVWLYWRSGQATWTYPWLYGIAGFITACLVLVAASTLLLYLKARRRNALERARNAKFVSQERGVFDHKVTLGQVLKVYVSTLSAIGTEMGRIGETSGKAGVKMDAAGQVQGVKGDALRLKVARQAADNLTKHSQKMETQLARLEELNVVLIESSAGYLTWLASQGTGREAQLTSLRNSLQEVLDTTRASLTTIQVFRDKQDAVRGWSQDLNTAMNRLAYVTDGIIAVTQISEKHWEGILHLIDQKSTNPS